VSGKSRTHRENDGEKDKQFPVAGETELPHNPGKNEFGKEQESRNQSDNQADRLEKAHPNLLDTPAATQHRHKKNQGDDRDILQKKNAESGSTVDCFELGAVGQDAENTGSRGKGNRGSKCERGPPVEAEGDTGESGNPERDRDLKGSSIHRRRTETDEASSRELKSDRKEEERDAQLGDHGNAGTLVDDVENAGTEKHSGNEIPENGRLAKSLEQHPDSQRAGKQGNQLKKNIPDFRVSGGGGENHFGL
jgi:hypothetical protein